MAIKLSEVLSLYKSSDVSSFLKSLTGYSLFEKNLKYEKIQPSWKFLGNNSSNGSSVNILKRGEKGLIERLTNAIDAVIEKQKEKCSIVGATEASAIIKKAFKQYYENTKKILTGEKSNVWAFDAEDQIMLVANDATGTTKITFDVIDKGTGIPGEKFETTILSLNAGNKLSREKAYLIGAFGQGGSTSLTFTDSTIVVSKYEGKYYFSIIREVELNDYKNSCYVYLTINDKIPELEVDELYDMEHDYLNNFINSESGTLVRMIETDISREYRVNDITKNHMLINYIDTNLFNVGLPVKIIDNRANFKYNPSHQDRNSCGSFIRMQNSKHIKKDWSGTLKVEINNQTYNIDYYLILPDDENKWGSDKECQDVFERFNVTGDPILYTVNGQMITSESFNKFKNATGLNFLHYRLLVVIDLDVLGMEKYKFFTSDRSRIRETDKTRGFLDKVFESLKNLDELKEINRLISEMAVNHEIDNELADQIAEKVKGKYNKMLKGGKPSFSKGSRPHVTPDHEEDYAQEIQDFEISIANTTFYCDQNINIILKTGAQKHVNSNALIYMMINGKSNYTHDVSYMNGRIQYTLSGRSLKPGIYKIMFHYYKDNKLEKESNEVAIEILGEATPVHDKPIKDKILDLKIKFTKESETICDIVKNEAEKSITAYLCFTTDQMMTDVFGLSTPTETINELTNKLAEPVCLFALFLDKTYDSIETAEEKNKLIISYIKSILESESTKLL